MKEAKITMYAGEEWGGSMDGSGGGYPEVEYDPLNDAVILRETGGGRDSEIWLNPDSMRQMIRELNDFLDLMDIVREKDRLGEDLPKNKKRKV